MSDLTHVDSADRPTMVDVSDKSVTDRTARARAIIEFPEDVGARLVDGDIQTKKGPVFATAIVAGVMGAKRTHELVPFCHPLGLDSCKITIDMEDPRLAVIDCVCKVRHKTGVEMEALTGATVAALTVYDMCKALSHDIRIIETRLMAKTGGKQDFSRE